MQAIAMMHFDMLNFLGPYSKDTFLNSFVIVYGKGPPGNTSYIHSKNDYCD